MADAICTVRLNLVARGNHAKKAAAALCLSSRHRGVWENPLLRRVSPPEKYHAPTDVLLCGGEGSFFVRAAVMQQLYQSLVQAGADRGALLCPRDVADMHFHACGGGTEVDCGRG